MWPENVYIFWLSTETAGFLQFNHCLAWAIDVAVGTPLLNKWHEVMLTIMGCQMSYPELGAVMSEYTWIYMATKISSESQENIRVCVWGLCDGFTDLML